MGVSSESPTPTASPPIIVERPATGQLYHLGYDLELRPVTPGRAYQLRATRFAQRHGFFVWLRDHTIIESGWTTR